MNSKVTFGLVQSKFQNSTNNLQEVHLLDMRSQPILVPGYVFDQTINLYEVDQFGLCLFQMILSICTSNISIES